jgi:hypothetical protein
VAELTAKLFRNYFGGSWSGKIIRNGEFQREIVFDWPEAFERFSAFGTEPGLTVPTGSGVLDNTRQVAISGWRNDCRRWYSHWYNEFGGYGELQWKSQDVVEGITVLYGILHECKQEYDDPTDHIAICEMTDQDNFKYTIRSARKGVVEILAKRIRTGKELNILMKKQAGTVTNFDELSKK